MENNTNISFRLPEKLNKQFQRQYPHCMSLFIRRAIALALDDPNFFQKVFLYNVKEYI